MRSTSPNARPQSRTKLESVVSTAAKLKAPVYISQPFDEHNAVSLFQQWLRVPEVEQATEEDIILNSRKDLRYLQEPSFNTTDDALFPANVPTEQRQAIGAIVWRRVTGSLYASSSQYCRLVQGCLHSNTWFLGALAAVSCKQDLLLNLIVSDDNANRGLYTFQFYKHGSWQRIVVDNRLPCLEQQQRLAFCSSGQAQELWPSLVEKAYARLHGGYAAIANGNVGDALVDLTGGVVTKISLADESSMADAATGALWSLIEQWLGAGSIIACTAKHSADADTSSLLGILPNAPYSILSAKVLPSGTKVLRLHCPWFPQGMWRGPWGPQSSSGDWLSEEGQAALTKDQSIAASLQDESTFWCTYWDFIQVFNRCWVVQLMPNNWHQISLTAGWVGALAGGPASPATKAAAPAGKTVAAAFGKLTLESAVQRPRSQDSSSTGNQGNSMALSQLPQQAEQGQQGHTAGASVSMSSSWCCNPQFKLTVSGSGSVVVCLGQRDAQVACKQYKPRKQRELHIGLTLLRAKSIISGSSRLIGALNGRRSLSPIGRRTTTPASGKHTISRADSPENTFKSNSPQSNRSRHKTITRANQLGVAPANGVSKAGRIWVPQECVLADTGLSSSREVVLRFQVEAGESYVLVPYTKHAGDTGPFTLRVYGSHAMLLEQLPSPLSLVIGGQWQGHLAGGRSIHATWGSNPQYILSCQRETTALLALIRPDVANSLIRQDYDPRQCIGLTLAAPEPTATGWGRRCCAAPDTHTGVVFAESDYTAMDEAVLLVRLQPEQPYVLVPSTAEPGIEAPFELRLLSSHPIELVPLPEMQIISAAGAWTDDSAGGNNLHASFSNNPAYKLRLQNKAACKINLTRSCRAWSCNQPLDEMVGFYVFNYMPAAQHSKSVNGRQQRMTAAAVLKQAQLFESAFLPMKLCEAELQLPAGELLIVPCTFAPGCKGQFSLSLTTGASVGLQLEAVQGGLVAAAEAMMRPAQQ